MYAAIDGLVDKLDRTIIKHKEKSLEHRHSGNPLKHHSRAMSEGHGTSIEPRPGDVQEAMTI